MLPDLSAFDGPVLAPARRAQGGRPEDLGRLGARVLPAVSRELRAGPDVAVALRRAPSNCATRSSPGLDGVPDGDDQRCRGTDDEHTQHRPGEVPVVAVAKDHPSAGNRCRFRHANRWSLPMSCGRSGDWSNGQVLAVQIRRQHRTVHRTRELQRARCRRRAPDRSIRCAASRYRSTVCGRWPTDSRIGYTTLVRLVHGEHSRSGCSDLVSAGACGRQHQLTATISSPRRHTAPVAGVESN